MGLVVDRQVLILQVPELDGEVCITFGDVEEPVGDSRTDTPRVGARNSHGELLRHVESLASEYV